MAPLIALSAGLLMGQVQADPVVAPAQQPPNGLFSRLRSWRGQSTNAPVVVPNTAPTVGRMEDRPLYSRIGDRFGGLFSRGHPIPGNSETPL